MWQSTAESLDHDRGRKYRLVAGGQPVAYSQVLTLWQADAAFRKFFTAMLAEVSYAAFRWETPPVTTATAERAFEFVLLRCDSLQRPAEPEAFADQFAAAGGSDVVTFANLGGDAVMVAPCPLGPHEAYPHLAAFVRSAPPPQIDHLWQAVGEAMHQRLGGRPVWLSTAGLGVAWLHVRLDSRPKYYGYAAYTR